MVKNFKKERKLQRPFTVHKAVRHDDSYEVGLESWLS
jgi:hypothetical protein